MKKTAKLAGLAAGLLAMVGVTFTSCDFFDTFGHDYYYGTWLTYDLDAEGDPIPYYNGDGNYYTIRWTFDGDAEDLGKEGEFRQHLVNYGTTVPQKQDGKYTYGTVTNETYWFGTYDIKGNSAYSKGKLFLKYQVGFDVDTAVSNGFIPDPNDSKKLTTATAVSGTYADKAAAIVSVLDTWTLEDFLKFAYDSEDGLASLKNDSTLNDLAFNANNTADQTGCLKKKNNIITLQVRDKDGNNKLECSDVEYFRFNLRDLGGLGYTRMRNTILDKDGTTVIGGIYNQWASKTEAKSVLSSSTQCSYGWKVKNATSWAGTSTRYMAKIQRGSNEANPTYETNNKKGNLATFGALGSGDDANDETTYSTPDSEIPEQ